MNIKILLAIISALIMSSCNQNPANDQTTKTTEPLKPLTFTSEAAPEWTALMEHTSGWFAADGIFTIPLDGVEDQQNENHIDQGGNIDFLGRPPVG